MSDRVEFMFKGIDLSPVMDLLQNRDISGWFKNAEGGENLRFFQSCFAEFCGAKHGIAVSSGSAAIYTALKACGVGRGDTVLVPSYTHVGSVAPIVLAGAEPVFVDVDIHGNFDPLALEGYEGDARALIAVHMLGMPCDIDEIRKRFHSTPYSGYIIEDASHALGSEYKGKKCGTLGDIGCFSIGGGRTKTIGCGEGGMITTNHDLLAEKCKNIRNHGDRAMDVPYHCFNFRMSELNALVGLLQMPRLEMLNKWQMENAEIIMEELEDVFIFPPQPDYAKSVRYIIAGLCYTQKERDDFLKVMVKNGWAGGQPRMNIGGAWSKLCSDIKFYQKYHVRGKVLSTSMALRDESVWIDWHRYPRTDAEIDLMLDHVKQAMKEVLK